MYAIFHEDSFGDQFRKSWEQRKQIIETIQIQNLNIQIVAKGSPSLGRKLKTDFKKGNK